MIAPQLLNQIQLFQFVTAREAPTYRAIVATFKEARQQYRVQLRPVEVMERLREGAWFFELDEMATLDQRLDQLVEWGVLDSMHDAGSVERIDDFYRRRLIYRLTTAGDAAHDAVAQVEAVTGDIGALQSGMLERVRGALQRLSSHAAGAPASAAWTALVELEEAFASLTEQAGRFIAELERLISSAAIGDDTFLEHKEALLAYISGFVERLRLLSEEIVEQIRALPDERWAALMAIAIEAAELPPPRPDRSDPRARWLVERQRRWEGIQQWFVAGPQRRSMVEQLAEVAQRNVLALMRALRRLEERERRPTDPGADFVRLAQWFAECETDAAAHALYAAAFGLGQARHFHLSEEDAELTRPEASWWEAPPVEVPLYLRSTKRPRRAAGRAARARDHAGERALLAAAWRRERRRYERAIAHLRRPDATRLSALGELDSAALEVLLELMSDALAGKRSRAGFQATTRDGRWRVTLQPPPDQSRAVLRSESGRLECADYLLLVEEAAR